MTHARIALALVAVTACRLVPAETNLYASGTRLPELAAFEAQRSSNDCGVAAATILLRLLGTEDITYETLRKSVSPSGRGVTLAEMRKMLDAHGLRTEGVRLTPGALKTVALPIIAWLPTEHYVVVESADTADVIVYDPGRGVWRLTRPQLWQIWDGTALVPAMALMNPSINLVSQSGPTLPDRF